MFRPLRFLALAVATCPAGVCLAQPVPYDPYADSQGPLAPLAPDGTIQWGTFFKSAALQKSYERLWHLGACRGTNKAITEPVEANKVVIDRLPEADYSGVVQGVTGGLEGGVVAFVEEGATEPVFAQLHPAGVSRVSVSGKGPAALLKPGMHVRLTVTVDAKGKVAEPVTAFDIVTPSADYQPDEVRPGLRDTLVGRVMQVRGKVMVLRIDAGRVRRVTCTVATDAVATLEAAQLDLVAAGDRIEVRGRMWSGAGCMGAGTIFASDVTVEKPPYEAGTIERTASVR